MRFFLRRKATEEAKPVERNSTPSERVTGQIRRMGRHSVSFSISYVEVAQWAKDPIRYPRPKNEVLNLAEVHAHRMGDKFILDAIEKARTEWTELDNTATPKLPPPPAMATDTNTLYREIVEVGPAKYTDHFESNNISSSRAVLAAKPLKDEFERYLENLKKT